MSADEYNLEQAIALATQGRTNDARQMLLKITAQQPQNEKAWLWLAVCSESDEQKQYYLNQVLLIQSGQPGASQPLPHRSERAAARAAQEPPAKKVRKTPKKGFLAEYWIELVAASLVAVGIFLLVEPFNIREGLQTLALTLFDELDRSLGRISQGLTEFLRSFTISDLTGVILLAMASVFIVWRVRARFLVSQRWRSTTCPRCGGQLERTHRTSLDHLVGRLFLPHGRRYYCTNKECGWSGLHHYFDRDRSQRRRQTQA